MVVTSASTASAQAALTVLTRNAAAAAPAVVREQQRPPERGPAVVVDARVAELAEAARDAAGRAAERDALSATSGAETDARRALADDLRRKGVEDFEESVVQGQKSLQQTKERIRIYEETGEFMTVKADGSLGELRPQDRLLMQGKEEEYVENLRKAVGYMEKALPGLQADAARMRAEYEGRGKA